MKSLVSVIVLSTLVSCSGGGGNGGGSGAGPVVGSLTHNQLAESFISELNLDADFEVTLVKKDTLQSDFLVLYDPYTDSYDAVNIDNYNPNYDNAADYYYENSARNYFDLGINPGHYETDYDYTIVGYDAFGDAIWDYEAYDVWVETTYEDYATGVLFEKVHASTKDLAKLSAIKEIASIEKSAQFLSSEFGLSLDRAKEVSSLKMHWKKASKKGMTNAEVDSFSSELLGFSLSDGIAAYTASAEGSDSELDSLIAQSAAVNGITPEHASTLMTKVFGL